MIKLNKEQIDDIIDRIENKHQTLSTISEIYKISPTGLRKFLIRNNINYKSNRYTRNDLKKGIKSDFFFIIDSEEKAYFLGLMYADGNVSIPPFGQKRMNINLHHQDKHILETFRKTLGHKNELEFNEHSKKKMRFKIQDQYRLRITSNKLCEDLISHGCVPAKSLILKFPKTVPDNLMRHFIRGLFDGDGGIYCRFSSHRIRINPDFRFEVTGTYDICNGINQLFYKLFGFKPMKLLLHRNTYKYSLGGNCQIEKVYHYLYDNSNPELCLIRKYNVFKEILNYEKHPMIKTSKYKSISYKNSSPNPWQIIKYKGRKCFNLGRYKTEFDAYIALCELELKDNIPFSNNPEEFYKYKNYNLSSKNLPNKS